MRIKCISSNPEKDPLISSPVIPQAFEQFLLSNTERTHHKTKHYEYLEQNYISRDCVMSFLDFIVHKSCYTQPIADEKMMTILYMLMASVQGLLAGFGKVPMKQGHSYLLYLPAEAIHRAYLRKGHLRVMYCSFSQSYLDTMATENKGIADLLQLFNEGAPVSLIEKPARITFNALYQMWQVKTCKESAGYREKMIKARGQDLVLEYVFRANEKRKPIKKFISEVLEPSERIFKAKEIIDFTERKLTIKDIAAQVNLSEQQLARGFKTTFQKPIGEYQTEIIIANVCELLVSSKASINEIADEVGYTDQSSLSRIFKKVMGVSPSEYQNASRKQE